MRKFKLCAAWTFLQSSPGFISYSVAQRLQVGALDRFDAHEPPLSVLTGLEFDALSPVEQANAVAQMAVFARVEPSHKRRLVELLKAQASQCCGPDGFFCTGEAQPQAAPCRDSQSPGKHPVVMGVEQFRLGLACSLW